MRAEFEKGNLEPWDTNLSSDLAIVLTQVRLSSKTLYGEAPAQTFPEVPYKDFIKAMTSEVENLLTDLDWDTRNVLLTLARIWITAKTNMLYSKQGAAEAAIDALPSEFRDVMRHALTTALGEEEEKWADFGEAVGQCSQFMALQIHDVVEKNNRFDRTITTFVL